MTEKPYFVHESSYVDEPCVIGDGTKIWHFCHVMKDSVIGKGCNIGQNVLVSSGVRMGDNCKIQNNVSLYTGVVLEDHVFCGPSMVFTNVYNPRSEIRRMDELRETRVRRGASLGANCTIVCGITIGQYAFVGAGSVVTRDVPDFALVVGNPGRVTGWMCVCGSRLRFEADGSGRCGACSRTYRKDGTLVELVGAAEEAVA
jgi:UDP-2-acetamido-3-amino-2,3-dideoxy-glucuronate N-acetyltransferase